MTERLDGKTAFVTGAGRNIGRAIALVLAGRGANVVVNGSSDRAACDAVVAEAEALGVRALAAMGDVGDGEAIRGMAAESLERFGAIDILVNNAAIRPDTPFLEMTVEEWRRVLAVDLDSAFHTARAFLPGMVEKDWGRIINLTGMNAIQGYIGRAPVSAAKHGLWGLTKALAREFGPHGVTVNAISPGPIGGDYSAAPDMGRHIEEMVSRIPLGRIGEPAHVAGLCGYLVSEAGSFVSGQMIAVNGAGTT